MRREQDLPYFLLGLVVIIFAAFALEKITGASFQIGSLTELIMGAGAIYVGWAASRIADNHSSKAVTPLLTVWYGMKKKGEEEDGKVWQLELQNHGLGPAIITNIRFHCAGASLDFNTELEMVSFVCESAEKMHRTTLHSVKSTGFSISYPETLPCNGKLSILTIEPSSAEDEPEFHKLMDTIESITYVEVSYQNIHKKVKPVFRFALQPRRQTNISFNQRA